LSRHVVIGTAGHVDHGKTALVKSLTGTDTDRWAEEKRRGITIDLGFAVLDLGGGLTASIVDVPGHEDFVRNMVAGATGVDVALMVVAADEGVMPQTVEHLAILEFLGVRTGVVVISKADLAEPEWMELVESDVRERLSRSSVAWQAPVTFSTVTGSGIDEVREALAEAAHGAIERSAEDLFRLPVDRVFSVAGAGTVVTGTSWGGSVGAGEEVRVLPGEARARVRSVQVHGEVRERAEPGRRTALALPGVSKGELTRGCVVVSDPAWRESRALDVLIRLLPGSRPLTQRSRVRLHIGTAEVMARVTPAAEGEIGPGEGAAARLRLERPLVARWGDRGVLRSYSPVHTIGGCVVVDPWPPARPRRPRALESRAVSDPAERVAASVALSGSRGIPIVDLPVRLGIHPGQVTEAVRQVTATGIVAVDGRLVTDQVIEETRQATLEALAGYHKRSPLELGMPRELLRSIAEASALADFVQEQLAAEGRIAIEGGTVRSSDFRPTLSEQEEEWREAIGGALSAAGFRGRTGVELAEAVPQEAAVRLAEFLVRQGTAVRIGRERYYERPALERLHDEIVEEVTRLGRATPAQLRERTGLTRKYLIPVLEWLDGGGFTVRDGDARKLGPAAGRRSEGS
jgi:selenocysteine-specific elongation factor